MISFSKTDIDVVRSFLLEQSAEDRIDKQKKARGLLLDEHFLDRKNGPKQ